MIDLSEIIFRAHEIGDMDESKTIPSIAGSSTTKIVLEAIKFRAYATEDMEDPIFSVSNPFSLSQPLKNKVASKSSIIKTNAKNIKIREARIYFQQQMAKEIVRKRKNRNKRLRSYRVRSSNLIFNLN